MRRITLIAALALIAAVAPSSAAARLHWTRPVTVAEMRGDDVHFSYFEGSADDRVLYLATTGYTTRLGLYPWQGGTRFGRLFRIPGDRGAFAEYLDANDAGALVAAWMRPVKHSQSGLRYDECWCRVEAVVRPAGGRFGRVQRLSRPRALHTGPAAYMRAGGRAIAAWDLGTQLRVAPATPDGDFKRPKTVAHHVEDFSLYHLNGRPRLEWYDRNLQVFAAWSPFTHRRSLGTLPREESPRDELYPQGAVASDGRGHELLVRYDDQTGDIFTATRRVGRPFGPHRKLVHAGRALYAECSVDAATDGRRRVVAAWVCGDDASDDEYGRAAYLAPGGRLLKLSRRETVFASYEPPALVAAYGRFLVTFQADYDGYTSLMGSRGRFLGYRRIVRARNAGSDQALDAIAADGTGLVTWVESHGKRDLVKASSIRLP